MTTVTLIFRRTHCFARKLIKENARNQDIQKQYTGKLQKLFHDKLGTNNAPELTCDPNTNMQLMIL